MTLTRVTLDRTQLRSSASLHDSDASTLMVALRMEGSKRTLRSNDISIAPLRARNTSNPDTCAIDQDVNISFSVQYPHYLKNKSNTLLIILQRRKKYKSRPIPGFKTLAVGSINMTEVIQYCDCRELPVYSNDHHNTVVGKLQLNALHSQPIEHDLDKTRELDDSADSDSLSSGCGAIVELAGGQVLVGSDSETQMEAGGSGVAGDVQPQRSARAPRQSGASGPSRYPKRGTRMLTTGDRQRKLKKKIGMLLKKFKIQEEELAAAGGRPHTAHSKSTQQEIQSLIEELENLSEESGPDVGQGDDSVSVKSTPKPSLRPFFPDPTSSFEAIPCSTAAISSALKQQHTRGLPTVGASDESRESESQDLDYTDAELSDSVNVVASGRGMSLSSGTTDGGLGSSRHPPDPTSPPSQAQSPPPPIHHSHHHHADEQATLTKLSGCVVRPGVVPIEKLSIPQQLARFMPAEENRIPDYICLLQGDVTMGVHRLADPLLSALTSSTLSSPTSALPLIAAAFLLHRLTDIRHVLSNVMTRIQKFCNSTNVAPSTVRILLLADDRFTAHAVRTYVDLLSQKSTDWNHYIRFYVVPPPDMNGAARHLCALDHRYAAWLDEITWGDLWNMNDDARLESLARRIQIYLSSAATTIPLPISEAMIQSKDSSGTRDESSQQFIAFVLEVRVGDPLTVMDRDFDPLPSIANPSPAAPTPIATPLLNTSLDSSVTSAPAAGVTGSGSPPASPGSVLLQTSSSDTFDLQIEYWTAPVNTLGSNIHQKGATSTSIVADPSSIGLSSGTGSSGRRSDSGGAKTSMKLTLRSLTIARCTGDTMCGGEPAVPSLVLSYTKEKKQQKMLHKLRMNKPTSNAANEQADHSRVQSVRGVTRVICSASKSHELLRVFIDGVEHSNIKYFQVSPQWSTHVRSFPIAAWGGVTCGYLSD